MTDSHEAPFSLATDDRGDRVRVITLSGELDLGGSPALREQLAQAMQEERDLIVADLSAATLVDSTTLSVLLNAHRRLTRRGGALALVSTQPSINRVLEVTLLNRTFDVHETRDSALASLAAQDGGV